METVILWYEPCDFDLDPKTSSWQTFSEFIDLEHKNPVYFDFEKAFKTVIICIKSAVQKTVEKVVSFYISLHCGFELEQINLISLHVTLAPGNALPYQVWIGKAEHFRKYSQSFTTITTHLNTKRRSRLLKEIKKISIWI